MPGEKPFGFHEGSRSEYLAQYVFASWGTAVVIPQQEDHGLDLHCTLMERVGGRLLAKWPYTVQVKSEMKPVVFEGKEAVRWFIEHPLPLFLCVVNKATARLSIYHTFHRFQVWSEGLWPDRLTMIPQPVLPDQDAHCLSWPGCLDVSLDQPILEFSVIDMLDEGNWQRMRELFERWVAVETDNLTRVRSKYLGCRVPDRYKTNEWTMQGWSWIAAGTPTEQQLKETILQLRDPLGWVCDQLRRKEDFEGVAKVALLARHILRDEHGGVLNFAHVQLNRQLGKETYLYAGVDHLEELVRNALNRNISRSS